MDKKISGVMILAVFLTAIATGLYTYDGTTYYCEDTDQVCIGTRLSSTSKTCYYNDNGTERGKRCSTLWTVYDNKPIDESADSVKIFGNGCLHTCITEEGKIYSYTECVCDNGNFAYAGELI